MSDSSRNTALRLRLKGTEAVTVMYAINDLDDVLRFGGRAMREYERRLSHARKLDEISKNMISLLNFHKLLGNQVSQSRRPNGITINEPMSLRNTELSQCSYYVPTFTQFSTLITCRSSKSMRNKEDRITLRPVKYQGMVLPLFSQTD